MGFFKNLYISDILEDSPIIRAPAIVLIGIGDRAPEKWAKDNQAVERDCWRMSEGSHSSLLNPALAQVSRIDFVGWVERQRNPTHYFKRVGFRSRLNPTYKIY